MKSETILLSVGGSLVVPDGVDIAFLKNLRLLVARHIRNGKRFAVSVGGGSTCRTYQDAARAVMPKTSQLELDWIGIRSTELNAYLVKVIMDELAHHEVISNPTKKIRLDKPVAVVAGWKPGCSTDMDTVLLAKNLGIKRIANLTNIDFVYDKDPRIHTDAKPLRDITWKAFRAILPPQWKPGLHSPFDPVASKLAQKLGLTVAIMNGNDFANLNKYITGKPFVGTVIHS
ncbi:UMP kinase [Candidatus Uhrbacteria bacterium]|nr:UMP kinase [Candidatus Uhrbacteria bacterium]